MDDKMTTRLVWELEQRRLIEQTLLDYAYFVDRNDPASLVDAVFTPDGRFRLGSRHAVRGHENLARMFARTLAVFSQTSHHVSNIRVSFIDDTTASATAYVYAWHVSVDDGRRIDLWGRYSDELSLTDKGWRISSRHLRVAGTDGWIDPPFEIIERLPNPTDVPAPDIERL